MGAATASLGARLGVLALRYPQRLGNGKDLAQSAFEGRLALPLLAALVILKPLATVGCLASRAPGGPFTSSLTFGALRGGLAGRLFACAVPGPSVDACPLIGAVAAIAITMQAPLAAFVLFLELPYHVTSLRVSMMASVALAVLVARRFEPRSVYSGKIYAGRSGARAAPACPRPAVAPWLTDRMPLISAAADYAQVVARVLGAPDGRGYVYVADEKGRWLGRIGREQALPPPPLSRVLSAAAAGDLLAPVASLGERAGSDEVERRLRDRPDGEWPVVEDGSGRLIGVVRAGGI